MLLKSKICLTVLAIYEMVAVSILHFQRICDAIFVVPFCDSWYRYFLFCIIVPGLLLLALMWIREIIRAHRRRKFIRRAKNTISSVVSTVRGKLSEHIDVNDMEKIITAAVLVGIKKYSDRHPGLRNNVNHIIDYANGDLELDEISSADVRPSAKKSSVRSKPKTKK